MLPEGKAYSDNKVSVQWHRRHLFMETGNEKREKNGYWSGLLSGLLLAVLLFGCVYVGRQVYGIYEAKQIANGKEQSELLSDYTTTKIEVIEDNIFQ